MALLRELLDGPVIQSFNVTQKAAEYKRHHQTLRAWLVELENMGGLARSQNHGGRGCGLTLKVNHAILARLYRDQNLSPSPTPLYKDQDLRSASAGITGVGLRQRWSAPRLKSNWPVTLTQLKAEFQRTKASCDPARRTRGWQRLLRRTCGYRGLALRDSKLVAKAWATFSESTGKACKREASLIAVLTRVLRDSSPPPATWLELRAWLHGCEQWAAHHRVEAAARRSEEIACVRRKLGTQNRRIRVSFYPEIELQ